MAISGLEACRVDLFTERSELDAKYTPEIVAKIQRVREIYMIWQDDPSIKEKELCDTLRTRHKVSIPTAYKDIAILKTLLPNLGKAGKDFHRWRYNEMILDTYNLAKAKGDVATMERAAASYARYNALNEPDVEEVPWRKIIVQPFVATDDPTVLGIEPIPNLREYIPKLISDLSRDIPDIMDVEAEEADIALPETAEDYGEESLL